MQMDFSLVMNTLSLMGILFLLWDKVRARLLRAQLNGKSFPVPSDEVKEAFRRAALAEASRLAGGRRVNLSMHYQGNLLVIESSELDSPKASG